MPEYVTQIDFIDRPGLGYEIFALFEKNGLDKIGMEVSPELGMMIKFRCISAQEADNLMGDIKTVDGVVAVKLRDYMPYEEREHELRTILNSVSEGIVGVNKKGKITHINEIACRIFHCTVEETLGLGAQELFQANAPILKTLRTGQSYKLKEQKIIRGNRTLHFLTSCVPVINDKEQIIGAVATIKDYQQVEEIISKVDRHPGLNSFDQIIYQSQRMRHLVDTAKLVAQGNSTILLRGESGTGKELFAKAIHTESPRARAPFIALNCAALSDTLLESELFGYEEGTFTGAVKGGKKGLFEQANQGTIFLDEIGEISPQVQVRLLRVLQEGTIRRVGGGNEIPVDVRVIAATHRDLEAMITKAEFREDLYYRLNVIPLTIPPLRERREDIPLLAQHLIRKICTKLHKPEMHLTTESLQFLMAQTWPGNVRQLENALERIINIVDTHKITPEQFSEWTDLNADNKLAAPVDEALEIKISLIPEWPSLKEIVGEVEKQVLVRVLEKHRSSRKAGKILGVSNTTILNKIKSYSLD